MRSSLNSGSNQSKTDEEYSLATLDHVSSPAPSQP